MTINNVVIGKVLKEKILNGERPQGHLSLLVNNISSDTVTITITVKDNEDDSILGQIGTYTLMKDNTLDLLDITKIFKVYVE